MGSWVPGEQTTSGEAAKGEAQARHAGGQMSNNKRQKAAKGEDTETCVCMTD